MTNEDIAIAIRFLKRVVTLSHDETELLIKTVEALEEQLRRNRQWHQK
jgi:hypothetical protein